MPDDAAPLAAKHDEVPASVGLFTPPRERSPDSSASSLSGHVQMLLDLGHAQEGVSGGSPTCQAKGHIKRRGDTTDGSTALGSLSPRASDAVIELDADDVVPSSPVSAESASAVLDADGDVCSNEVNSCPGCRIAYEGEDASFCRMCGKERDSSGTSTGQPA
jgi:hypothetical protein